MKKKQRDLLTWHENSDSFTKDKYGLPRIFYHGTSADKKFNIFEKTNSGWGYFFSTEKKEAKSYAKDGQNVYEVFLKMKKPFRADKIQINSQKDLENLADFLGFSNFEKKVINQNDYENFKILKDYFEDIKQRGAKAHLTLSETDGNYANFIDKKGKYITFDIVNPKRADEIALFGDFKHISEREKEYLYFTEWARNDFDLALNVIDKNRLFAEYDGLSTGRIKDLLQKQGYDGIIFNDFQVSVFDSNQIKSVKNTGSWTDSSGNISNTKPKDENAKHSYFNEYSPNILQSNQHLGAGLLGGALNGLETDENGNVIGFSPEKFVAGFLGGAGASKVLTHKAVQNHALKIVLNISNDFKALQEHNLPLFAKIIQKIEPQTLLKSSKEAKKLSDEVFNKELSQSIQNAIDNNAVADLSELKKQVHFTKIDEFKKYFDEVKGNQGIIKTPYKDIKVNVFYAFNHFTDNTYKTNRENIKPAFFTTFKKPLFVVEFTPQGKNKPSTYFYKPFYDKNKKLLNLIGISINERGQLKFSTFYLDKQGNRLKEFLKRKDLIIRYVSNS